MTLPFTVDQFIGVFRQYNLAIWPLQIVAYLLGLAALALTVRKTRVTDRVNSLILSFFWLWMGIVYHEMYFSPINTAAYLFGALFVVQGLVFLVAGALYRRLSFGFRPGVYACTGIVFILYAMIVYPVIGALSGHGYPDSPCFGIAPCPATIFTFGLLLLTDRAVPKYAVIVPFLWSLLGFTAALKLCIREDVGLLVAGIAGTLLLVIRDRAGNASPESEKAKGPVQ